MVSLRKSFAAGAAALGAFLALGVSAEAQYGGGLPPPYGVPQPQIAVPTPTPTPTPLPGAGQATQVFTTNDLNLRVGAGTSYPAIAVMPRGSAFLAYYCDASGNWCFGDWNGLQGWASARYLTTAYYPPQPPAVVYPVQPPPIIVTPGPRYYGPGVNIWLYAR